MALIDSKVFDMQTNIVALRQEVLKQFPSKQYRPPSEEVKLSSITNNQFINNINIKKNDQVELSSGPLPKRNSKYKPKPVDLNLSEVIVNDIDMRIYQKDNIQSIKNIVTKELADIHIQRKFAKQEGKDNGPPRINLNQIQNEDSDKRKTPVYFNLDEFNEEEKYQYPVNKW